ncbi:hypothetical protein [Actinomadura sp. 6N118]|uniref:hypothetical protein n=1 Tax=Actinomadura sp. 6N118 TaxID=3375151 RepID=UPI0037A3E6AE
MRRSSTSSRARRAAIAIAVPALTLTGVIAGLATPASAATTKCADEQYIYLDGGRSWVGMQPCVHKDGNYRKSWIRVRWFYDFRGTKWDGFDILATLERNDVIKNSKHCDFTDKLNASVVGDIKCTTATLYSTTSGGWTADGEGAYNFNLDGRGYYTKPLHGSPKVS